MLLPTWLGATQTLARSIDKGEIVGEGNVVPDGPMHALMWKVSSGSPPPTNSTPVVTRSATSPTTINAGSAVTTRGSFSDPDKGPLSFTFQWQDGTTTGSRSKAGSFSASYTYRSAGIYNVTLSVTDKLGAVGTSNVVQVTVRLTRRKRGRAVSEGAHAGSFARVSRRRFERPRERFRSSASTRATALVHAVERTRPRGVTGGLGRN